MEVAFTVLYYFVDVSNVIKANVVVVAVAVTTNVIIVGVYIVRDI